MMLTLELFNKNFALSFSVGIRVGTYVHLAKRRSCYCKELPLLAFFHLCF